jgi:MFS family permease
MLPHRPPSTLRRNLSLITADGVAFSVMVGMGEANLVAFGLALGIGQATAGLLATVPMLAGGVLQLIAPWGVRRLGSHKRWCLLCVAGQSLAFAPLLIAALAGAMPALGVFLSAALYWGSGMGAGPAWNTWAGTLIPERIRAHYFARRTRFTQASVFLGLMAGGFALQRWTATGRRLEGFALLFAVALICRALSFALVWKQSEPVPIAPTLRSVSPREMGRKLRHGQDGRVLLYLVLMQIGVQTAGPFFTPYMLEQLHFSYIQFVSIPAVAYIAKIGALPLLGRLAKRWGAVHLLTVGALAIVPLSLFWMVSDNYWYLMPVQVVSGVCWGTLELATILVVFETIHADERTSILTMFNFANCTAIVVGSLIGHAVLRHLGEVQSTYMVLFVLSTLLRIVPLALLRGIQEVKGAPVPVAVRTDAVQPNAGSLDRPLLPSLPVKPPLSDGEVSGEPGP